MNNRFKSLVENLIPKNLINTDKDIMVHYMVTKKPNNKKTDIANIINFITVYIQNNEIYFEYMPTFVDGVLIFGIIGTEKNQNKLETKLGKVINKLNGKLKVTLKTQKGDEK